MSSYIKGQVRKDQIDDAPGADPDAAYRLNPARLSCRWCQPPLGGNRVVDIRGPAESEEAHRRLVQAVHRKRSGSVR